MHPNAEFGVEQTMNDWEVSWKPPPPTSRGYIDSLTDQIYVL